MLHERCVFKTVVLPPMTTSENPYTVATQFQIDGLFETLKTHYLARHHKKRSRLENDKMKLKLVASGCYSHNGADALWQDDNCYRCLFWQDGIMDKCVFFFPKLTDFNYCHVDNNPHVLDFVPKKGHSVLWQTKKNITADIAAMLV